MEQLYDMRGQRKYLTEHERNRFLKAARSTDTPVRAFCEVLALTGCRLSEALALTPDLVDPAAGVVVFESFKKRRRGVFRAVPVPTGLAEMMARSRSTPSHALQLRNVRAGLANQLWPWLQATAWRRVRGVMRAAEVDGAVACPRGLRHAFGIMAVAPAVPLTFIQKWMGHADLSATAIYLDASGIEERRLAFRMWHWELSSPWWKSRGPRYALRCGWTSDEGGESPRRMPAGDGYRQGRVTRWAAAICDRRLRCSSERIARIVGLLLPRRTAAGARRATHGTSTTDC